MRGYYNNLYHKTWDGSSWQPSKGWENLGHNIVSLPEAVSWGPNRIDVFLLGADGLPYQKTFDGTKWLDWESLGL